MRLMCHARPLVFCPLALCLVVAVASRALFAEETSGKPDRKPNRLVDEKSPYLLQHAYNPVDWFAWGNEAFAKAKADDKPIFLSIGYSTCHWCHVMERESFESEEVAEYLNEHFVCIKVDREERPDVDGIYMDAAHAMGNRGGWPLSVFLTVDRNPFFAGTYFPPEKFLQLCNRVIEVWKTEREKLETSASGIAERLQKQAAESSPTGQLQESQVQGALGWYRSQHDETFGGFGSQPKFPRTSNLDFLMRYARRTGDKEPLNIVYNTLDNMIRGGMRDHLGGGFHRYSTDRYWLVPHFEKMLYDNALIPRTLLDAYRVSGNPKYLDVVRETFDYLTTRMRDPEGGFYSAEDADTEHREGLTYLWERSEILEILGKERGTVFADYYGAAASGNFSDPHHPEDAGKYSVLHITLKGGEEDLAQKLGRPLAEIIKQLAEDRAKLLKVRDMRPQPFLDDKVLVEWNGMVISAFAHGFQVTGEERYLQVARKAADFILTRMVKDGRLYRRYRGREVAIQGFFEDYAYFVEGLIDLYECDFEERWLKEAVRLGKDMVRFFWDEKGGAFFSSATDQEQLFARRKEFYDGAIPSGNSVAFLDLLRLYEFTTDKYFGTHVEKFKSVAAKQLTQSPQHHPQLLCAAEFLFQRPLEIVVVGPQSDARTQAMLGEIRGRFLPSKIVVHAEGAAAANAMSGLVPLLEAKMAIGGNPTTFVCRDRVCKLPARDLETLRKQLDEAGK